MVSAAAPSSGTTSWVGLIDRLNILLTSQPVYPCFLLASPRIDMLQTTAQRLVDYFAWSCISIGAALSEGLLAVPPSQRPREARLAFNRILHTSQPKPILCVDIDLLFDPTLSLNPLQLLRDASRRSPLVVMWPGQLSGSILQYAVPEHAHYRLWSQPDLCDGCILQL